METVVRAPRLWNTNHDSIVKTVKSKKSTRLAVDRVKPWLTHIVFP